MASTVDESPPDGGKSDVLKTNPYFKFSKLEEYLKIWYDRISPRYVDLVSDFAGQEFFLLDGEALLQCIFNDPMLDLAGSKGGIHPIPAHYYLMLTLGFQMLHVVYLVERFLLNLLRRRCFFSIIFFNGKVLHTTLLNVDFGNVSALSESVETMMARTLARKLVIQHIRTALSDKVE